MQIRRISWKSVFPFFYRQIESISYEMLCTYTLALYLTAHRLLADLISHSRNNDSVNLILDKLNVNRKTKIKSPNTTILAQISGKKILNVWLTWLLRLFCCRHHIKCRGNEFKTSIFLVEYMTIQIADFLRICSKNFFETFWK